MIATFIILCPSTWDFSYSFQYLICLSELYISKWRLNLTTWIRAWKNIIEMCIYETEVNDRLTLMETFVFLIPFLTNANSAMWEKSPMLWKDPPPPHKKNIGHETQIHLAQFLYD